MARTHGEKIDELKDACATLTERVSIAVQELNAVYDAHSRTTEALSELRSAFEREIALLKREVDDLKKWKDDQKKEREERSPRLWAFGPNAVGAVINVVLAAAVAYLVANR